MMPAIYGNSYEIVQGPGYVAIRYEMVNELRVIPLDGRPHVSSTIRTYMGDARGHFEGDTLVVETTNFTDKVPYRGSSQNLRLIERFTPARARRRRVVGDLRRPGHVDASVDVRDEPHARRRSIPFDTPATKATTRCGTCSGIAQAGRGGQAGRRRASTPNARPPTSELSDASDSESRRIPQLGLGWGLAVWELEVDSS